MEPWQPGKEDVRNLIVASLVFGVSFAAFFQSTQFKQILFYVLTSLIVLITREIGIRSAAQNMTAYVDTNLSLTGSIYSIFAAFTAVVLQVPVILLFPLWNEASMKSHEQWGKTVDALWLKRKFWLHTAGILALFTGWAFSSGLGMIFVARMYALTAFFFLLPFDYDNFSGGKLDGADILRWNGFYWLVLTGLSIVFYALTY